jgi:type VI secretion system secreted protein Hcp
MAIYMKYEGIDGSVTAKGHEKWIELESAQFGVHRCIRNPTGRGTNREASVPSMSELKVTKYQDCAATFLVKAGLWGEGKKVTIDFVKTDEGKFETYLQLELENTLISNYSASGVGGDNHNRPTESLSLNFTKITVSKTHMDQKNKTGTTHRLCWDLATCTGA